MCASTLTNHWLYRETAAVQLVVTILFIKNTRYGLTCLLNLSAHFRIYTLMYPERRTKFMHTHTHIEVPLSLLRYNHETPGTYSLSLTLYLSHCVRVCECECLSMYHALWANDSATYFVTTSSNENVMWLNHRNYTPLSCRFYRITISK